MPESSQSQQQNSRWTTIAVLNWTAERLERGRKASAANGSDAPRSDHSELSSARLEAEVLLAHCLGVDRLRLYLNHDKPLGPEELAAYRSAIRRRLAGEPVSYITGHKEFWSLDFEVTAAVLTPRPESELLVEIVIDHLAAAGEPGAVIVDVGTGSGALAVTLAREVPLATLLATDISEDALAVARANAARHEARVTFYRGDLLDPLAVAQRCDVIVANLPYVPSAELSQLMPEVSHWEPKLALDGGADGLDLIRRLVPQAAARLDAGGLLALEIAPEQRQQVQLQLQQAGFERCRVHQDLGGFDRVVSAAIGLATPGEAAVQ